MNVTMEVNEIIVKAYEFAKSQKHEYITAEHILYQSTFQKDMYNALEECNADIINLRNNLLNYFNENIEKTEEEEPQESYSFQQVLIKSSEQAIFSEKNTIALEHIVSAIYSLDESYAVYFLALEGVEKSEILFNLCHKNTNELAIRKEEERELVPEEKEEEQHSSFLDMFTVNLNEYVKKYKKDPLIGRTDIIERTIQVLCRRNKNNPLHVGEPGVGKTVLTWALADLINRGQVPEKLRGAEIYSLDIGSLLAGTKYRGDFEERVKKVLNEINKKDKPIVFIDEIHSIVGAGSLGTGALDASNLLKPYLMEGKVRFIGATTFDEYKKYFEKDKGLSRRFEVIEVKEPTVEETVKILKGLKKNYEEYHGVRYSDDALLEAATLSSKYINDKFLPDKAIDIIDEAGAYLAVMEDSEEKIVDEKIIEEVVSKICNIPKQTVETDEINSLKTMEKNLKENIFGQDEAIEDIVKCIKMSRAGLKDDNKPVASMLFVGPTGVGKTEIAKTLASNLGVKLIRFDMSEYGEKHAASKLIGAPPGYVGYEEGGLLTEAIRKQPYSVLLLDEIEKAHPDILSVLLQIMDYATLTDNQGRKADFRNVIIIMTSNAGAKNIGKNLVGFGERIVQGEAINDEVKKVFTPEFRNRLDKIVVFNHVNEEMAKNITLKEIKIFKKLLEPKNISLDFTESCLNHISKKGVSKEYGAREIHRIINSEVKSILVDEILFGKLKDGGNCIIDVEDGKYITKM